MCIPTWKWFTFTSVLFESVWIGEDTFYRERLLCRFVYLLLYINVYNLCEPPIQLSSSTINTTNWIDTIIHSSTTGAGIVDLVQQHQEANNNILTLTLTTPQNQKLHKFWDWGRRWKLFTGRAWLLTHQHQKWKFFLFLLHNERQQWLESPPQLNR
jgi:hypothetical protein